MGLLYKVRIRTGEESGAGTNANVFIQVTGDLGRIERQILDKPNYNDFETGDEDDYWLYAEKSIGIPEEVYIGHDNSGSDAGWYLDWVKITDPITGKEYNFDCHRWLARDENDKEIKCTLFSTEGKPKAECMPTGRETINLGMEHKIIDWRDANGASYTDKFTFSVTNAKTETGERVNTSEKKVSTEVTLGNQDTPVSGTIAAEIKGTVETRSEESNSLQTTSSTEKTVSVKPGKLLVLSSYWKRIDEIGYIRRGDRQFPYRLTVSYDVNIQGRTFGKEETLPPDVVEMMKKDGMITQVIKP
jgi:hypothetical protein